MEHLLLKAATTAIDQDQGMFEAVVSSGTVDRERDIVDPDGMVKALQGWTRTGKKIPLAWNHSDAPENQIGWVDPASAKNVAGEVVVSGQIDLSIPAGEHAWRLVKAGTLGFSFGYLTLKATARSGGGRHITELDVFEITASPTPMHNDTRVLGWKASMPDPSLRIVNSMIGQAQEFIDSENDPEDVDAMRDVLDSLKGLRDDETTEPSDESDDTSGKNLVAADVTDRTRKGRPVDPLRAKADAVALEHASGGESLRKKSPHKPAPKPTPEHDLPELKRRMREEMLTALSGGTQT